MSPKRPVPSPSMLPREEAPPLPPLPGLGMDTRSGVRFSAARAVGGGGGFSAEPGFFTAGIPCCCSPFRCASSAPGLREAPTRRVSCFAAEVLMAAA